MKKALFVLVAMLTFATSANAQFYIGGSFGFTTTKIEKESGSSYKIIPDFGYQLNDKMSVGLQIGYSHGLAAFGSLTVTDIKQAMSSVISGYADMNEDGMKLNSFTVSPYFRYNVVEFGIANLFVEAYVGYNNIKVKSSAVEGGGYNIGGYDDDGYYYDGDDYGDSDNTKINAFEIGVRPGIAINVNEKLDIVCKMGALGYVKAKEKESDVSISRFGLDFDTYNLLMGVNFHF